METSLRDNNSNQGSGLTTRSEIELIKGDDNDNDEREAK